MFVAPVVYGIGSADIAAETKEADLQTSRCSLFGCVIFRGWRWCYFPRLNGIGADQWPWWYQCIERAVIPQLKAEQALNAVTLLGQPPARSVGYCAVFNCESGGDNGVAHAMLQPVLLKQGTQFANIVAWQLFEEAL